MEKYNNIIPAKLMCEISIIGKENKSKQLIEDEKRKYIRDKQYINMIIKDTAEFMGFNETVIDFGMLLTRDNVNIKKLFNEFEQNGYSIKYNKEPYLKFYDEFETFMISWR